MRDARLQSVIKKAEILDPNKRAPQPQNLGHLRDLPELGDDCPLFCDFARVWFERKKEGLSDDKHIDQNWSTLKNYVFSHIGHMRLDEIKQRHIISVFDPVWRARHETARRTLGLVKEVFELAKLLEHVEVNPADSNAQTAIGRVAREHKHQPALEWEHAPEL